MVKNLPEEFFTVAQEPSYQESITGWIYTNHESSPFQEDIPLTNKNVVKGSLKVNKRCTTNNELIIGTACVGQLSVILTNIDWPSYGALDWLNGFRMSMSHDIFLRFSNEWLYLPLGNYYIDTVEVVDSGVSIIAYDEMSLFDVKPSYSDKRSYRNCWALISEAATACGVTYTETEAQFIADTHKVNTNEGITIDFSQYKTWREIIALAAQMIACNAIIARDEGLKFYDFYLNTSSSNPYGFYSFNEKQRLRGCKFSPYLVRYTSMYITDDNGEEQFYVKSSNEAGCVKLGKTLMNSYEAYPRTDQEVDQLRTNVLEHISYHWDDDSKVYFLQSHPFNVNIRFPCVMDVMDSVMFTGGILGSEGYHWGIITSWEWTFQGGYKLIGTGTLPKVAMGVSSTEKLVSGTTGQISKRVSDISDSVSDIDDSISDINDEIDSLIANKQNFIDLDILQPTGSGQEGDLKFYGPLGDGKKKLYRYENGQWIKIEFEQSSTSFIIVPSSYYTVNISQGDYENIIEFSSSVFSDIQPNTQCILCVCLNFEESVSPATAEIEITLDNVVVYNYVEQNLGSGYNIVTFNYLMSNLSQGNHSLTVKLIATLGNISNINIPAAYIHSIMGAGSSGSDADIEKVFDRETNEAVTFIVPHDGLYLIITSAGAAFTQNYFEINLPSGRQSILEDSITVSNLPRFIKYKIARLQAGDNIVFPRFTLSSWPAWQSTVYKLTNIDINSESYIVNTVSQSDATASYKVPDNSNLYLVFGVAYGSNTTGRRRDDTNLSGYNPLVYIKGDDVGLATVNGLYFGYGASLPIVSMYGYDGGAGHVVAIKV